MEGILDLGYDPVDNMGNNNDNANQNAEDSTNLDNGSVGDGVKTRLDGSNNDGVSDPNNEPDDDNKSNQNDSTNNNNTVDNITHEYGVGTEIEVDDNVYTINEKGDVVDKDGTVIKEMKDVNDWIKSFESNDDDIDFIGHISKELNISFTDDNDQDVTFENTPEGITEYVKETIASVKEETHNQTIAEMYSKYPFLKDITNYYTANGNSLDGYGEQPDRSSITIDIDDTAQQENIVRAYFKENKIDGNVDDYIEYLKDKNKLYDSAVSNLQSLKDSDAAKKADIEKRAKDAEEYAIKQNEEHWSNIKTIVDSNVIAGYQIPESIVRNVDGKKVTANKNDFYSYINKIQQNGKTAYQNDLEKRPKDVAINNDLLAAFIAFTGGDYSSLVKHNMNKEDVNRIRLKASSRKQSNGRVKVSNKTNNGNSNKTIVDFGY